MKFVFVTDEASEDTRPAAPTTPPPTATLGDLAAAAKTITRLRSDVERATRYAEISDAALKEAGQIHAEVQAANAALTADVERLLAERDALAGDVEAAEQEVKILIADRERFYNDIRAEVAVNVVLISEAKGRGLVAARTIPAGEVIERAPVVEFPQLQLKGTALDDYAFDYTEDEEAVILGLTSIANHSDAPNAGLKFDGRTAVFYAEREIGTGDEVTIDYGVTLWFAPVIPKPEEQGE